MIEHVDPWAITIAVVCAPLVAVAISGVLDVVVRRSQDQQPRRWFSSGVQGDASALHHDPRVSPDLSASSHPTDDQV